MAEKKESKKLEREYIIPLRKKFLKAPRYDRSRKAVKAIKQFIAKHMKVEDRDLKKVKLDKYLNNEIWSRGMKKPPAKVKVKAIKEDGIVKVDFVEVPQKVKFARAKHEKLHKAPEKSKETPKAEEKPEEKTEEEKKDEVEKEKAVEEQNIKQAEIQEKAQKHTIKAKEPGIQRKALKK